MKFKELSDRLTGESKTNGWDAVCAMNAKRTSDIFFQQYLSNGPTNPDLRLKTILEAGTDSDFMALDLVLGPPEISFPDKLKPDQCQVKMYLIRGSVLQFDPYEQVIRNIIMVQPNRSWITGPVGLNKVSGEVSTVGKVEADLGANAYSPQIEGIDPNSITATKIGTAVQTFFRNRKTRYELGTIVEGNIADCLKPTHFEIVTQPDPSKKTGGCVALLIQTDGQAGSKGQLAPYPIAQGDSATLMVSNPVMFNRLLPPFLTTEFKKIGTKFKGHSKDGIYTTNGSGGSLDLGKFTSNDNLTYSSDADGYPAKVKIDAKGFEVSAQNSKLTVAWSRDFSQYWSHTNIYAQDTTTTEHLDMKASYTLSSRTAVDETTDVISFSGKGSATFNTSKHYKWWQKLFEGDFDVPSEAEKRMKKVFEKIFDGLRLPSVNEFALANILFPSLHALQLKNASMPCDLLSTGDVAPKMAVKPALVPLLNPGGTQQFQAFDHQGNEISNVLWEIKPASGSINAHGLYTAPETVNQAEAVIITAVNEQDTGQSAKAMALIAKSRDASDLIVSPSTLLLTANQDFVLEVTDAEGNPVEADCTATPDIGTLTQGWTTGHWRYTAPGAIQTQTAVTINAKGKQAPDKTGAMDIFLTPTAQVTVTPASASVKAGGTVDIAASSDGVSGFTWQVYGSGSIAVDKEDASRATYTAPATAPSTNQEVMITAYFQGSSVGIGLAQITVEA